MEQEMERFTRDALRHFERATGSERLWQPRVDMCETEDAVLVFAELAGLTEEEVGRRVDITLTADGRALLLRGSREESQADGARTRCHLLEIMYGSFQRAVHLPTDVRIERERITATYANGILKIVLPKRSPEAPRMISVGNE
jgi:HSP20 family protein